jgi:hypothetical protein
MRKRAGNGIGKRKGRPKATLILSVQNLSLGFYQAIFPTSECCSHQFGHLFPATA